MNDSEFDTNEKNMLETYGGIPELRLDNLLKKDDNLPIKLSMIISFSNWRREQLARSLETIARQNFRDFEVLITDIGSTQDMDSVYQLFEPYLRMKVKRIKRSHWSSDATRGIVVSLPDVSGDIIAVMQPEMMLHPDCFNYLYNAHFDNTLPDLFEYQLNPTVEERGETYVAIRNGFLSTPSTHQLNSINWHDDIREVENMPDYWTHTECLSSWTNRQHLDHEPHKKWAWWFCSSAKKTATIWEDMPELDGHGGIDFYFINYRHFMGYTDICPQRTLAYHQEHIRASISPDRENWLHNHDIFRQYLRDRNRTP